MLRRIVTLIGIILLTILGIVAGDLIVVQRDHFIERPGEVNDFSVTWSATDDPSGTFETARIESTTGLAVNLRTLRPAASDGERHPLLLIIGGHRTGKDAVALVGAANGLAYAAIDYPYDGSHSLDGLGEIVATIPDVRQAFLDTPPALSLAVDWLLTRSWVDPDRIELVGISLGVPFAAVAGALDERFRRVWLIHGGADNQTWIEFAARKRIENEMLRRQMVRAALFVSYGNSFDTRAWIDEIAPRPLVIVAARDDDRVPPAAQQGFVEAAVADSVELIWTDGLHIGPTRNHELGQLLGIVSGRVHGETK